MNKIILALMLVSFAWQGSVSGAEKKKHLSTNVNFEDLVVSGQYQYPDEATATVENEKTLNDLIGVRKDFKDRLKLSSQRR